MSQRLKRKRDWVGRTVKLLRAMETKGGNIFPAGTLMEVRRNFGGLELTAVEACQNCKLQHRHYIKKVAERDVVLLPEN